MSVVYFALYLLFAGQLSWSEICVAIPAAILPTAFLAAQGGPLRRRLAMPPAACARTAFKALASVPADTWRVGRVLLRTLAPAQAHAPGIAPGMLQVQPFRRGSDDPAEAGRRALVTLGLSLAPNGYVVDFASGSGLLIHRLQPVPP